jgi:hypothetical protein
VPKVRSVIEVSVLIKVGRLRASARSENELGKQLRAYLALASAFPVENYTPKATRSQIHASDFLKFPKTYLLILKGSNKIAGDKQIRDCLSPAILFDPLGYNCTADLND